MKRAFITCFASMAIFYSALSQPVTLAAFPETAPQKSEASVDIGSIPQQLIMIPDGSGNSIENSQDFVMIHYRNKGSAVDMGIYLHQRQIKAHSDGQKAAEKILIAKYHEKVNPRKTLIKKRIYAEDKKTGEKFFVGLTFWW